MDALNLYAAALEERTLALIQAGEWEALSAMIAPECQFVTNTGIFDKEHALALMQGMKLASASIRSVQATEVGDNLIVSFELACRESIGGTMQSEDYSPRLSVWKKVNDAHVCIAYGDFNRQ